MEISLLDRELAATKHFVDAIAKVKIGEEVFVFHPEFFGEHEKDIPERMYKYSARIMDKYPGLGVYGVVFYINEAESGKSLPNVFERSILGKRRNYYEYDVVNIGELDAFEILRQEVIGLLPLVPLMRHDVEQAESLIRQSVQQLNERVDDAQLRAETLSALYLFSGLRQLQAITQKILKEAHMLELLKKSKSYQEIRSEGHQEGEVEGVIRSILAILRARFGTVPKNFSLSLQKLELKQLNNLVIKAMSARSLAAFEALLYKSKTKNGSGVAKH
jgi:predicted transposase YdaD